MGGLLDRLRRLVAPTAQAPRGATPSASAVDKRIALGVLLWIVAEADGQFLEDALEDAGTRSDAIGTGRDRDGGALGSQDAIGTEERLDRISTGGPFPGHA